MSASEIYSPAEEEAAFAEVYRLHHQKLLRYCQYRLHDRHEAEDVMQEAFIRAWRSMPASAYGHNFYPWLRVVAGNLCTDVLRKRSRSEPVAEVELGVVDGGMDAITEEEDRALVRQALLRLNDRHRMALTMREEEGLTYDQIAQRTGVTAATVESLLWRARQALKREFTVVAGRASAWSPVPLLAALAARVGAARRRAAARLARRLPNPNRSALGEPISHLALAAITTLTVVGGLAATFGTGGPARATPADRMAPMPATGTASRPSGPAAGQSTVPVSTAVPALGPARPTVTAEAAGGAITRPAAGSPSLATMRVLDPITSGRQAARTARQAPLGLTLGAVAVGASPQEAAAYLNHTSVEAVNSAGTVTSTVSNNTKESNR